MAFLVLDMDWLSPPSLLRTGTKPFDRDLSYTSKIDAAATNVYTCLRVYSRHHKHVHYFSQSCGHISNSNMT